MANGSANSRKGSVGHLLDAFLDHANTRGLAPKTIVGYELLAKQAKAEFGAVDLRKLTAQGSTATTADRSGAVCRREGSDTTTPFCALRCDKPSAGD